MKRTPDLLPVLKENGVVDAGGFGLAILVDAFTAALLGKSGPLGDELALARAGAAPKVAIEQINDWEGSKLHLLQRVSRRFRRARQGRGARLFVYDGRL